MNKRLLAGLMAFCLAAGAANAAFAEDPPLQDLLHTETTGIATGETAATPTPPGPTETPADEAPAKETPAGEERPTPLPSATPEAAATPESAEPRARRAVQVVRLNEVKIQDNIQSTGELVALVNGSSEPADGVTYTWYRSKTGAEGSWQQVVGQAVSGDGRNLTDTRPQALNAALDTLLARSADPKAADTDRYHYRVEVTAGGVSKQAEAQVGYYVQLQNGSFEYPVVSDSQFAGDRFYFPEGGADPAVHFLQTLDASATPGICWYTTASEERWWSTAQNKGGTGHYIEIADGSTHVYDESTNDPKVEYHINSAYDGNQFAEINCQGFGALYQDVLTVPDSTLNWSLAHAGRDGTDTMALLIAPVEAAQAITAKLEELESGITSTKIKEVLADNITVNGATVPISNYIVDGNITDGKTEWGVHNGTYIVPKGQYVSRFFFVAVASASGDGAEGIKRGNLIDRVWFSTDPVPPASGKGILRITKTLLKADGTDLTAAELVQAKKRLNFTVVDSHTHTAAEFSGDKMHADSSNPRVLYYTLELPLADSKGNTYNYAVTETTHGEPDGYRCTQVRTAKDGGAWSIVTDLAVHSSITLTAQTATNIQFENTYARATGSLTITKHLPEDADDALRADFAETVNTFTITSVAQGSYTPQYTAGASPAETPAPISPDADGRLTISLKGIGSVTLPGLDPGSYTVIESNAPDLTNYYLTTPTADRTRAATVTAGGSAEVQFTNTYAPYLSVTIAKKVMGNMGDTTKDFAFTAKLDTTQIRQGSAYTAAGDGARLTDTGFTLRSGGSITLTHLREDQTLTLTETDPGSHTVSWQLNGDDVSDGQTYSLQVPRNQPAVITCINTRNASIPTGLRTGAAPYLVLVGLCWVSWWLLRRREV